MEKLLFLFLLINFMFISLVNSAPSISDAGGNFSNAGTIIISGSGFGNNGPNVVFFDDFEKGTNGDEILTGIGSAQVGKIRNVNGISKPYYANSASVSGSLAFQADMSSSWYEYAQIDLPDDCRDIFISWWLYLPLSDNAPGEGNPAGRNWKQMWIQGESTSDDDLVIPTLHTSWQINGNEPDPGYSKYVAIDFQKGEWKRLSAWLKGGSQNDGACHFWELDDLNGMVQRVNDNSVNTLKNGGAWEKVRINGYGRQTLNSHPTFDDVYLASGPSARARIEIGNNAVFEDCTKLTIATPTSWNDTQITATLWQGQFEFGDNAHLFVVDEIGEVSSGHPITIGGGCEGVCVNIAAPLILLLLAE